jgi:hypothetical protein
MSILDDDDLVYYTPPKDHEEDSLVAFLVFTLGCSFFCLILVALSIVGCK